MRNDARDPRQAAALLPTFGVGTRSQWVAAGASQAMFEDGRLSLVVRGLWALPNRILSPINLLEHIRPLIAPDTAIGGWAAALLHGVRDAGPTMRTPIAEPVQLSQPRTQHRIPPGCTTLRVDLTPDELTVIDGFTVPTVTRTAYDMVRFCTSEMVAALVLDCFVCELNPSAADIEALAAMLWDRPRNRGNARLRAAIERSNGRSRSPAETRMRLFLREVGVPPSQILVNATLDVPGEPLHELDLVDLSSGLNIEYDGPTHANPEQRSRDARKDTLVNELGMRMLRVVAPDMRGPREDVVESLRRRRAAAIRDSCDVRALDLVRRGYLREDPLRLYSNAPAAGSHGLQTL